ncbi:hypothetical protein ACFLU1_00750 [Chloroflexota bacterium]
MATVTMIAALGISAVMSVAAVITLIAFLAIREMAGVSNYRSSLRIARFVSIGILPLIMAFAVIVIVKIAEML